MGAAAVGVTTTPLRQPLTNEKAVFTDHLQSCPAIGPS